MATGVPVNLSIEANGALAALQISTASKRKETAWTAERNAWTTVSKYLWRMVGRTFRRTPWYSSSRGET